MDLNAVFLQKIMCFLTRKVVSKVRESSKKGITIEDDCWIGSNVTILDGVTIGKGCVIGAGTLVTKDIPAGSIVVDKREKVMRERYKYEICLFNYGTYKI